MPSRKIFSILLKWKIFCIGGAAPIRTIYSLDTKNKDGLSKQDKCSFKLDGCVTKLGSI